MSDVDPLKADFRNFLYVVWRHLNLPPPTPVQYDMAWYLQHGPRRKVMEAYRGAGKSWITSAYVDWLLLNDPESKILVVSASKDRADSFSTFTKRLITEIPELAHLKPGKDDRDSNIMFDVGPAQASHSPSVKSVGVTGQMTGSRANYIIADDVETPSNALTQLQRERLSEAVKEFDSILLPGGSVTYLGTPQSEASLYNVLPERGYQMQVWPARYPTKSQTEAYDGALAPKVQAELEENPELAGNPTDPERFTEFDLQEREASYGRTGFALQFMLDTSLSDANRYPLKISDFMVFDIDPKKAPVHMAWSSSPELVDSKLPNVGFTGDRWYRPMKIADEWAEYTGTVMAVDPSGRGNDETGVAVVKILHGMLFVVEATGLTGGYSEETMNTIGKLAWKHSVNQMLIEDNFGDGMFTQLLKPWLQKWHNVSIEETKHSTQKEARMLDTLEPILNQHRLIIDRQLIQTDFEKTETPAYQLMVQLTRLTRDRGAIKHDDRLEALSMAVQYWVNQMDRDVDQAQRDHEEELWEQELAKMEDHIIGKNSKTKHNMLGLND